MAFTPYDLVHGIDFTALANATAADHNTLVDSANPKSDSATEGRGLVVWSKDAALDVPTVPDPLFNSVFNKWKRYIWIRVPHALSTNTIPLIYIWNDDATSVATYLKWQRPEANFTTIDATIAALDLRVDDLEASSASTLTTANAANSTASTASINATNASSTANAANANATTALANAATAQTAADAATAIANTASTNASNAITTANAATAAVTAIGPQFIAPVTVYSGGAAGPTTYNASASVPSNAKAVILDASTVGAVSVTIRKDASSSYYNLVSSETDSTYGSLASGQGIFPVTAQSFQYLTVGAGTSTIRLIGYIL